ncbi:cobyrinic acid a,c-diamide synthase [Actinokineospora bangkokensis]|uniref:Cobyrinic acid a,c-diamide synthase n=1 Tax=Actinokineospora bangkokensis TaxID=1193682 RepID=A0A1Q9LIB6_9PSEU|nr:cobyrinic acid a,c-diamide synthase [Actinokineospora bangkokensis]OLR91763.1 hypothetical protein BJP25_24875 [Actinokineospora bangkokensis]
MTRRTPLPGADELFRSTAPPPLRHVPADAPPTRRDARPAPARPGGHRETGPATLFDPAPAPAAEQAPAPAAEAPARGTPRQKHTSKITVYVSDEELLALEQARLALRAVHGLAVDRGRVVREAVAVLLADLDEHGGDSVLVRRLRRDPGR